MEKYKINGKEIHQPDTPVPNAWETTYTEDSGRVMSGQAMTDPLFTVENLSFTFSNLTLEEVSTILKEVVPTPSHPSFTLHYLSAYYGGWRDATFYVGKGSLDLQRATDGRYEKLTFNAIGVDPL